MNVTLFRDLPTEGWHSMERYADELSAGLQVLGCRFTSVAPSRPLPFVGGKVGAVLNHLWRAAVYPFVARRRQGTLNHILDHSYANLLDGVDAARTIVTCHDLAPLALNEGKGRLSRFLWERSLRMMGRAAHVIADSHFTKNELIRLTAYPADQISVVWLGVSDIFLRPASEALRAQLRALAAPADEKIILHVGSCLPRKNLATLLEAVRALEDHRIRFVQVGGLWTARERQTIAGLGLERQVTQVTLASEDELRAWYAAADVLVLPSIYEGFGLPVLEAMAARLPVVCSATGSVREIAGEAALFVDPRSPIELARSIQQVLQVPELADSLRVRGAARASEFGWQRCASETLNVYLEMERQLRL